MKFKAFIFDMDGTLCDTNDAHAQAWQESFKAQGYEISIDRINEEIGKGGDQLVAAVIGEDGDKEHGDALREGHTKAVIRIMGERKTAVFPGARELIERAREAGLKVALASSSKKEELEAVEKSSGVQWTDLFDLVTSSADVEQSKPAPDLVTVTAEKLGLAPADCIMVGDTIYDADACRKAGVTMVGVRTGPDSVSQSDKLHESGASKTYHDTADLRAHFDEALGLAI